MTVWGPIPAFDGDDGRPAPRGFVGAATMTRNPLLPARAPTAAAAGSSTCRARPVSTDWARPADGRDRLPHQLAPVTGGAGRPCSCAVPPPCRDDRDRRPRSG